MSPSFMPVVAQEGVRLNSMRPRGRITRSRSRQILERRELQRRGRLWLQSCINLKAEDSLAEKLDLRNRNSLENDSGSDRRILAINRKSARQMDVDENSTSSTSSTIEEFLGSENVNSEKLSLLQRREGLLNITIRTVNLMRKNQQLQKKLAQLQAETRAFVKSVLSNPENKSIQLSSEGTVQYQRQNSETSDDSTDVETERECKEMADSESGESGPEK